MRSARTGTQSHSPPEADKPFLGVMSRAERGAGGPMTSGVMPARVRSMSAAEAAWIAAVPCALATLAAVVLLGPAVGHAFLAPRGEALWPPGIHPGRPEPAKHGRFVVALLGPVALAGAILVSARARPRLQPRL